MKWSHSSLLVHNIQKDFNTFFAAPALQTARETPRMALAPSVPVSIREWLLTINKCCKLIDHGTIPENENKFNSVLKLDQPLFGVPSRSSMILSMAA